MRQISNLGKLIFVVLLFIVGLFFVVTGIMGIKQANNWPETTGVIQSIEMTHEAVDSEDNDEYEVMVKYTVDGKTYTSDLGVYHEDFEVGKEIKILYSPESPDFIVLPGKTGSVIGIVAGIAAMIGAVITLLLRIMGR